MTEGRDTRMKPAACPNCERVLDGAYSVFGPASPSAGDFTICAYCRAPLRYTEGFQLRRIAMTEFLELVALIRKRQAKETHD